MSGKSGWLFGIFSLVLLTGCGTASLSDRVAKLEAETAAIQQQIARPQDSVTLEELFTVYLNYSNISPVLAKRYLLSVELPENPTPMQVDLYLSRLAGMARINGDEDYQIILAAKIAAIGEANLPKLLPYLQQHSFSRAFIILGGSARKDLLLRALNQNRNNSALTSLYIELVEPADADTILGMLERNPEMIMAVKKLRLEARALPVIQKKLLDTSGNNIFNCEPEWLKVALDTMEPAATAAFIDQYWKKTDRSTPRYENWNLMNRALNLAARGYLPAFQYLGEGFIYYGHNRDVQQRILMLADCRPDEFPVWYAQNRDKLVFDAATGRFRAPVKP